jgi:uncharacterized membrane protein
VDIAVGVLRVALSVVFIGMGISHFAGPARRTMRAMIPPALAPHRVFLVAFTGLCEIAGGLGLVLPWQLVGAEWMRWVVGILLVAFLIAVFPANAYAAKHPQKFGRAAIPFWPRLIGQLALIGLLVFVMF